MTQLAIQIGVPVFLLFLGLSVGRARERQHFASLERREEATGNMLITQMKSFPRARVGRLPPRMMVGEAVIATDYLKSFLAKLRGIFGGEIRSYQNLMVRARREAVLRIVEQARREGYDSVCNIRLQTADVGGSTSSRRTVVVAILATGTAYETETTPP